MNESEAYEFALKIFEEEEGRKPNMRGGVMTKDEVAVSTLHVGIVHTLRKFNLLTE